MSIIINTIKEMTLLMLHIKTLNPQVKSLKLLKMIHDNGLSEATVAQCIGKSASWVSSLLNHRELNKHDSDVIKKVVKVLAAKKRGNRDV